MADTDTAADTHAEPEPTPEPTESPQLQAAFAAREAFLNEQAVYSGYAVPANVSYAVSELPFAHGRRSRATPRPALATGCTRWKTR